MAKKMRKKRNFRLKKTARRSIAAVLMISAVIVALIPTPKLAAQTGYHVDDGDLLTIDNEISLAKGNNEQVYDALTITQMSDGQYQLDWQFKFFMRKVANVDRGVICEYNSTYQRDTVDLNPNVTYEYYKVTQNEFDQYYILHDDEEKRADAPDTGAYLFLQKYFPTEYEAWVKAFQAYSDYLIVKAEYDTAYQNWINNGSQGAAPSIPTPVSDPGAFVKYVRDLSYEQKLTYYCDMGDPDMQGCTLFRVIDASASGATNVYAFIARDSAGDFKVKSTSTIIAIGDKAFEGTKNVYYLNLPGEIKYIGDEAFMNSFIRSVSFRNVMNIGNRAFRECTQLSSVSLGDGTSVIGTEAFRGSGITEITFPYSVQTIGPGAFAYCSKLASADFRNITQSNCLVDKNAFYDDTALNSVEFGNSTVTTLGDGSFGAEGGITGNLTSFVFPSGISSDYTNSRPYNPTTNKGMGSGILAGRTNLQNVVLPANYGRSSDVTLPVDTFSNCINLASVEFPDDANGSCGLVSFDDSIFNDVINDAFYVRGPEFDRNRAKASPRKSTWKTKLKSGKSVPYVYKNNGVDYYEISDGKYLQSVSADGELISCEFAEGVTPTPIDLVIGEPIGGTMNVTSIANNCFSDDIIENMKSLEIKDDSVQAIADGVFEKCPILESVIIGNSVKSIGNNAFKDCSKLVKVNFHTPKDGHTGFTIGTDAFATGASELTFYGDIVPGYAPFDWSMAEDNYMNRTLGKRVCYRSNAPTNLTVIRDNETDLVTLIDYPHYVNIDADNQAYCDEMHEYYQTYYPDYQESSFSILDKYENIYVKGNTPAHDWENVNQEMLNIVNATQNITIPAGIESIDVNKFLTSPENAANIAYLTDTGSSSTDTRPNTINGDSKKSLYSGVSLVSSDVHPGLFSGEVYDYKSPYTTTITGLEDISTGHKKGNDRITSISLTDVQYLPDYAFEDCELLQFVSLGAVEDIGTAPFVGCETLDTINGNDTYQCVNGIIYSVNPDSSRTIEQCLSTRGTIIEPRTLTTASDPLLSSVSEIKAGAFQDCNNITRVDLSDATALKTIPENCFNGCDALYEVSLPESVNKILDNAFTDNQSALRVTIPGTEVQITHDAFTHDQGVIRTYEDSAAYIYATLYGIDTEIIGTKYKVSFLDWDGKELCPDQYIESGSDAKPPNDPVRPGYIFDGWNKSYQNITKDTIIMATYTSSGEFKVTFLDYNGTELSVQYVAAGGTATAPANPTRTGYTFSGWSKTFSNISEDTTIVALYTANGGGGGGGGGGTGGGGSGGGSGSNGSNSGSSSSSSSGNSNKTYHKLTVTNGSGGGYYYAGYVVNISAHAPPAGQNFQQWTSTSNGVGFTNAYNSSTTFTMPDNEATVVANFGVGTASSNNTVTDPTKPSGSSGGSGGSGGSGSGNGSSSNSTGTKPGGTVVSITKPGFSDTDKASAVVHGSGDNYIIKITEDANAQAQIEAALLADAETLENIKYFPMDISLYDSTGATKITDTTGLSVDITLPLPDELRKYGGNNKVAGVVNGALDKLTPTFKSIDGVPCVTFKATHFSPYTIYVDTANLSDGAIDSSPKTGDPVHPKWFLAIGLASLSIILFAKKDRRIKIKIS